MENETKSYKGYSGHFAFQNEATIIRKQGLCVDQKPIEAIISKIETHLLKVRMQVTAKAPKMRQP